MKLCSDAGIDCPFHARKLVRKVETWKGERTENPSALVANPKAQAAPPRQGQQPKPVRFTRMAISCNISVTVFGGFAPRLDFTPVTLP